MNLKPIALTIALVASCHGQTTTDNPRRMLSMRIVPSEDVPTTGTCKDDTGGFLEVGGTQLPNNMDDAELGRTIKRTIKEGYTMTLTPQVSNRLFVSLECNARHPLIGGLPSPEVALQGTLHSQPRIESRYVDVANRSYRVEYFISNPDISTIPAVAGGQNNPHYSARIAVWELGGAYPQQVGKPFPGTYVDGGCFEDDPKEMVLRALRSAAN